MYWTLLHRAHLQQQDFRLYRSARNKDPLPADGNRASDNNPLPRRDPLLSCRNVPKRHNSKRTRSIFSRSETHNPWIKVRLELGNSLYWMISKIEPMYKLAWARQPMRPIFPKRLNHWLDPDCWKVLLNKVEHRFFWLPDLTDHLRFPPDDRGVKLKLLNVKKLKSTFHRQKNQPSIVDHLWWNKFVSRYRLYLKCSMSQFVLFDFEKYKPCGVLFPKCHPKS